MVAKVEVRQRAQPRLALRRTLAGAGVAAIDLGGLYAVGAFPPPPPSTRTPAPHTHTHAHGAHSRR
jgi:hypothetical protein